LLQFLKMFKKKKKQPSADYVFSPSSFEQVGGPGDGALYICFVSPPPDRTYSTSDTPGVYVIYEKVSDTRYKFVGYGPAPWETVTKLIRN
jgi:hypothetical protein